MTAVRTEPLTVEEIVEFGDNGYLLPGRVLDDEQVEALRAVVDKFRSGERTAAVAADLLNPDPDANAAIAAVHGSDEPAPAADSGADPGADPDGVEYYFGLYRTNEEFRRVSANPTLAGWARQLLGANAVRLVEDDIISKEPHKGGPLAWHQDHPYFALAQPNVITAWIALDDVTEANGAMYMAVGSHLTGERLPVSFKTGAVLDNVRRPSTVVPIGDPYELGYQVRPVEIRAGEVSLHHPYTWHASGPNRTDRPRRAILERYMTDGTIWLGAARAEAFYPPEARVDEMIGLPLRGDYFPIVPDELLSSL